VDRPERSARVFHAIEDDAEIDQRPREPIDFRDEKLIAGLEGRERAFELGPGALDGGLVLEEDLIGAGRFHGLDLRIEVLGCG
jgi:hypothetical protein